MTVDGSDRVIVSGFRGLPDTNVDLSVWRYTDLGQPDPTFGGNGAGFGAASAGVAGIGSRFYTAATPRREPFASRPIGHAPTALGYATSPRHQTAPADTGMSPMQDEQRELPGPRRRPLLAATLLSPLVVLLALELGLRVVGFGGSYHGRMVFPSDSPFPQPLLLPFVL